jgi:UPF0271 protein
MLKIDLNSDLGESFGAYTIGNDAEVLKYITSANIACGFHAGDPSVMKKTVRLALDNGVAIGAHPGLPDLQGFGRRKMNITPAEAYNITLYQISALYGFVKAEGGKMQHVKPHGALYNAAAKDAKLSEAIAEAIYKLDPELILFGLAGSELVKAAKKIGLNAVNEVFADRSYQQDGSLTPRNQPGAMITDETAAIGQVLGMIKEGRVKTQQGQYILLQADTVCVHGDGVKALAFTQKIRETLLREGIQVGPFK